VDQYREEISIFNTFVGITVNISHRFQIAVAFQKHVRCTPKTTVVRRKIQDAGEIRRGQAATCQVKL